MRQTNRHNTDLTVNIHIKYFHMSVVNESHESETGKTATNLLAPKKSLMFLPSFYTFTLLSYAGKYSCEINIIKD